MFSLPDLCVTRDFDKNHLVTRESEFEKSVIRGVRNEFDTWTVFWFIESIVTLEFG